MKKFNMLKQKGAVFGIDARIALVIMAISSLAIAYNKLAVDESKKLQEATFNILKLSDHILEQYETYHEDITIVETIYAETTAEQNKFFARSNDLKFDPWGNQWQVKVFSGKNDDVKILGEPISPFCFVVFSAGADGKHYLADNYTATSYADCLNNVGLTQSADYTEKHDDLFYKFTTIEYDLKALTSYKKNLEDIIVSLNNYFQAEKNKRIFYCNDLSALMSNTDPKCDIDGNNTYTESELDVLNFYPHGVDVSSAKYADVSYSYDKTSVLSRKELLSKLGLAKALNEDMWGRVLVYASNSTSVLTAPYIAAVKYEKCPTCGKE